jgi:hypothetical protein
LLFPAHVTAYRATIVSIAMLMPGCDKQIDRGFEYDLSGGAQVSADEARAGFDGLDTRRPSYEHAAAGYLVLDDSPIEPWCGAVLVAPDVVLTSSACVEGRGTSRLGVGFALPNSGSSLGTETAVVLDADPRLAALVLASPVDEIEPASVGAMDRDRCDVDSVSYLYVTGDDVSERWVWTGCFDADSARLVPDDGGPNCHGDSGAPAFSASGDLVGLVVGASGGSPCIESVSLAVLAHSDAFDEALELSAVD